jgi:hypothetical protein
LWAFSMERGVENEAQKEYEEHTDDDDEPLSNGEHADDELGNVKERDACRIWDSVLGIGASLRRDVVDWILNVCSL